ncbi:MAG: thioredoxin domain-containing protein [Dehalococcoidia bacterium]
MQPRRARKKQASTGRPWVPIALIGGGAILVVVLVVIVSNVVGGGGSSVSATRATPGPTHAAPENDASVGQDSAPATLIEYFRFDCSHCADYTENTAPSIEKDYVDTGKLRIVFHPLALNGDLLTASEAALCAGEQNRYWDYHDLLFANFSTLNPYSKDNLKQYAKDLGLDTSAFNSCLDSDKYKDQIANDTNADLQAGVNSTPTFYLGTTSVVNGESLPFPGATQIIGAQPYSVFKADIDKVLAGP